MSLKTPVNFCRGQSKERKEMASRARPAPVLTGPIAVDVDTVDPEDDAGKARLCMTWTFGSAREFFFLAKRSCVGEKDWVPECSNVLFTPLEKHPKIVAAMDVVKALPRDEAIENHRKGVKMDLSLSWNTFSCTMDSDCVYDIYSIFKQAGVLQELRGLADEDATPDPTFASSADGTSNGRTNKHKGKGKQRMPSTGRGGPNSKSAQGSYHDEISQRMQEMADENSDLYNEITQLGTVLMIGCLKQRNDLNGHLAFVVQEFDEATGRIGVEMLKDGEQVRVMRHCTMPLEKDEDFVDELAQVPEDERVLCRAHWRKQMN